jgi:uncharacterized protein
MNGEVDTFYWRKKAHLIGVALIIVGALNWLLVGVFDFDIVRFLFGKSVVARAIYIVIGLSAVAIMCNRDTYLPFLGETVLPCAALPNRIPPGASKEVRVTAAPGSKILYWASEPALESLTKINDWRHAYQKYENAGVTTADETGVAILKVRPPQPYVVPWKGRLEPHVHFRVCGENGMLGRVKTVFVKDGRVEGFSGY